ncbi:MAG: hypothetical protein HQL78_14370 [Magnetococcales bacterium]|nr:hypothetical protein [Magnetococcales bacterium]
MTRKLNIGPFQRVKAISLKTVKSEVYSGKFNFLAYPSHLWVRMTPQGGIEGWYSGDIPPSEQNGAYIVGRIEKLQYFLRLNLDITEEAFLKLKNRSTLNFNPFYTIHKVDSSGNRIILSHGALRYQLIDYPVYSISTEYSYSEQWATVHAELFPGYNTSPQGPRSPRNTNIPINSSVTFSVYPELNALGNADMKTKESIDKILNSFPKLSDGCYYGYPNCKNYSVDGWMGFPEIV